MRNKFFALVSLLIVASMVLAACQQTATPAAPGEPQVTTIVETQIVEVAGTPMVITATPEPTAPPMEFTSADPNTFVRVSFGEGETLDPALNYESAGGQWIYNIYERLIEYNREKPAEYVPGLALEVPTAENGLVSADGLTYTFNIRPGVVFHEGGDLTPSDVAYSLVRGLLQGGSASPQILLTEPFYGVGYNDVAYVVAAVEANGAEGALALDAEGFGAISARGDELIDNVEGMLAVDPEVLAATCELTKSLIVADDAAGTVTMKLATPWAPFVATLANYWGSIMDQEWVVENGGWSGECDSWQNTYAITSASDPFTPIANGTGPYKMDHWTQGEEFVMVRNENYWRTEPAWEGGPSGPAAIERIIERKVDEWGTRFAMAQAGDADSFVLGTRADAAQVDPLVGEFCNYDAATNSFPCEVVGDGPFKLYQGAGTVTRTDVFLNFNIANPEGGNPLIGSGQLDGNGIPPDFFSDVHIRKAFNYCFDWETFNQDALLGEAVQSVGIPLPGMPGYDPEGPIYSFDADKCAEEFGMADVDKDGIPSAEDEDDVTSVGFRFQAAYNIGNVTRQTVAEILASNLAGVNELFSVEVIGLPWPTFLRAQRELSLPLFISGWHEDIHDPHNWYVPYLTGVYGARQSLPEEFKASFQTQMNAGIVETDPDARHEIYTALNQEIYDLAPQIILSLATNRMYMQRWVEGWNYNPIRSDFYYYELTKK